MRGPAWDGIRIAASRWLPAAVVGLGLLTAIPQPASAQFFGWGDSWAGGWGTGHWSGLRSGEINRAIAEQGFRVISPLRRSGSVFVADVVDRRGRRERLIVAAANAQILQRFYLDDPRLPGFVPRNDVARDTPEDPGDWSHRDPVPPASIPRPSRRAPDRQGAGATADRDQGTGLESTGRQDDGAGQDDTGDQRQRPAPRALRPRPRIVDRTPDAVGPRDPQTTVPTRPRPKPSDATRDLGDTGSTGVRPAEPGPKVANKPPEAAPLTPAAPSSPRMRDPLAIPGGEPKLGAGKPVEAPRSSAAAVPAPRPAPPAPVSAPAPAKSGDVPVAPLD